MTHERLETKDARHRALRGVLHPLQIAEKRADVESIRRMVEIGLKAKLK
jgi:hypothetical protein